ncbi:unnamed protein product [Hermetia illucens]|uniref:Mitochondrial fission process protein 1 n=1 Tax=Hermetia illucens TaxID=343691 RepID=A0A7R8UV56_HERIL|nr:mitochondrial fission process protein 1-like isoform X1 [Hermetia illucens]CAD7087700.1 unnamed protein product [Hermetia illucens]
MKSNPVTEKDPFRNSILRLLGYAGIAAQLFSYTLSRRTVGISQTISTSYVLSDIATKTLNGYRGNQQTGGCLMAFIDAAVWQTFATYMIPRFAVTGVTRLSREILTPTSHSHTPPLIGLFTILVLSKPIDNTVDLFLDSTLRKL